MAKQARPLKSGPGRPTRGRPRTADAKAPAPKTATAVADQAPAAGAADPAPSASQPAAKPAVALVPEAPADRPKRRGRPAGGATQAKPGRKARGKAARPDILFLVETEEESGRYELQPVGTVATLLDLMDENRKVVATRSWREF